MKEETIYKIIVAGDGAVGKTTMLHYYIDGVFKGDTKLTVGVEFFPKKVEIMEKTYNVVFWDVGGQERFREMHRSLTGGAVGAVLMFDLSRLSTLNSIEEWLGILRERDKELPILLVGSKYDLIREMAKESIKEINNYGLEIKEQYNLFDYCITSSKIGFNINHAFRILLEKIKSYHDMQAILERLKQHSY